VGEWAKARYALHQQMYPPEEKAARQREATARYRKAHAKRIELARTVSNILLRQSWHHDDAAVLAKHCAPCSATNAPRRCAGNYGTNDRPRRGS
jgi:hypothetical protein